MMPGKVTHGLSLGRKYSPEYKTYLGMRARCSTRNPNTNFWKLYGARGITVCERWLHGEGGLTGAECFIKDMGPKPTPKHTLDRINNDGDYEPDNCRWATYQEQLKNKRDSYPVDVREAAEKLGISPEAIYARVFYGMTYEEATTAPRGTPLPNRNRAPARTRQKRSTGD